jgi:hypothetical protein
MRSPVVFSTRLREPNQETLPDAPVHVAPHLTSTIQELPIRSFRLALTPAVMPT